MNSIAIVGSSIQPREGRFTYSKSRSFFNTEERFRQTIFTVNSIRNCLPHAKIIVLDSSDDYKDNFINFGAFPNVDYIPIKELSYDVFEAVNTHLNKSYCESLLFNSFYRNMKKELLNYDYIIKVSGRYFLSEFNDSLFTEENVDKIFFKKPLRFIWQDHWNYSFVDRRNIQNDNMLYQYCSVLYAFGSQNLEKMIDINEAMVQFADRKEMIGYDIETLAYYFTRPYQDKVIETDWKVAGWDGVSGQFMYY